MSFKKNLCHTWTDDLEDDAEIITAFDLYAKNHNLNVDFPALMQTGKFQQLRDNVLYDSQGGRKIIALYYVLNRHFYSSLNAQVILESLQISDELSTVVDHLNNPNYNGVIFNQNFVDKMESLISSSVANSSSREYAQVAPQAY